MTIGNDGREIRMDLLLVFAPGKEEGRRRRRGRNPFDVSTRVDWGNTSCSGFSEITNSGETSSAGPPGGNERKTNPLGTGRSVSHMCLVSRVCRELISSINIPALPSSRFRGPGLTEAEPIPFSGQRAAILRALALALSHMTSKGKYCQFG